MTICILAEFFRRAHSSPMQRALFNAIGMDDRGDVRWTFPRDLLDIGDEVELSRSTFRHVSAAGLAIVDEGAAPASTIATRWFAASGNRLCPDWREAVGNPEGRTNPSVLIARLDRVAWHDAIAEVAQAYGLSRVEKRLLGDLTIYGDFVRASAEAGLKRTTARNTLARLRRKMGARNLPELILQATVLLSNERGFSSDELDEFIAGALGLSLKQCRIVLDICDGSSRTEAAQSANYSISTVKVILAQLFLDFSVGSVAELSALIGQARLVAEYLLRPLASGESLSQLRTASILAEDHARKIGYSMYGSGDGPVIAILHSTITCRHPPSQFVNLAIRHNWRVLAIDRPGFGDTDSPLRTGLDDHIVTAASDMMEVARIEGIARLVLVARGSGQMAIALSNLLGPLFHSGVLVNPTPHVDHTTVDRGPLGAIKRRFARQPLSTRVMIRLLLTLATPERLARSMRRAFASSPPDVDALEDHRVVTDYLAAVEPVRRNQDGYVTENTSWAQGWEPLPKGERKDWKIIFGRHFVLHDPDEARSYFKRLLPNAKIRLVRDAGQMLMYSHPEVVLAEIEPIS